MALNPRILSAARLEAEELQIAIENCSIEDIQSPSVILYHLRAEASLLRLICEELARD